MKTFVLLVTLFSASFLLTGCIGLTVTHPRQKSMEHFALGERGVITNSLEGPHLTKAEVLEHWGKPDSTTADGESFCVWHYQGNKSCGLIMPAYFIALPIPFPCGRNQASIYFKDGIAQKADGPVNVISGAMIGLMPPLVLAWEKETDGFKNGECVGYGFLKN